MVFHVELSVMNTWAEQFRSLKFHQKIKYEIVGYDNTGFCRISDILNRANDLLVLDILTVRCRVERLWYTKSEKCNCPIDDLTCSNDLLRDLTLLHGRDQHSDVVFCVQGIEFPAHRAILSARSPVLKAMLQHDMKEKLTNRVDVPDVEPELFKTFLLFIYTGRIQGDLQQLAEQLVPVADKYQVRDLKNNCEKVLIRNLTVENVVDLLLLADFHSVIKLRECTIGFIRLKLDGVMCTSSWQQLKKSYSHLVQEISSSLSKQF